MEVEKRKVWVTLLHLECTLPHVIQSKPIVSTHVMSGKGQFAKIIGVFKGEGCRWAFSYLVATKMNQLVVICTCTIVCVK